MAQRAQNDPGRRWIVLLAIALAGWGLYHAIGAFLFNHDVRRGLVVLASMTAFLCWWMLLLRCRAKRRTEPLRGVDADRHTFQNR